MMAFIASPLVVVVILTYAILIAFERGPSMVAEPVGAGAGRTGGANALGQSLFGTGDSGDLGIPAEATARGAELLVHDATGRADAQHPILLLTNHDSFDLSKALPLSLRDDGQWILRLPPPRAGRDEPLAFRFVLGQRDGTALPERSLDGEVTGARRLPRVSEDEAIGETPLRYRFVIRAFGDRAEVPPSADQATDPG